MSSSSRPSKRPRLRSPSEPDVSESTTSSASQDPAASFAASLEAGDRLACVACLEGNSSSVTQPGSAFEWLRELLAMGLSPDDIVSLLFEDKEESPWICCRPWRAYHHRGERDLPSEIKVKRSIAKSCGFCGIVPSSRDRNVWRDLVSVQSHDRSAMVSYGGIFGSDDPAWLQLAFYRCCSALDRLLDVLKWLQPREPIRDYIIALRLNNSLGVEAVQIPYGLVTSLEASMESLRVLNFAELSNVEFIDELCAASIAILCLVSDTSIESWMPEGPNRENALNMCALAMQTLCVTMLSFSQAHLGEIDPFFLEHSLSHISLFGSNGRESERLSLRFTLVSLTCVGEMVNSQVMAFADSLSPASSRFSGSPRLSGGLSAQVNDAQFPDDSRSEGEKAQAELGHDLVITLGDVLGLWGPGEFMRCSPPEMTDEPAAEWSYGLVIRGGIIYQPSKDSPKMHWAARTPEYEPQGIPFKVDLMEPKTIGALDLINTGCPTEPDPYLNTVARENISTSIEELGTWPESWGLREIQCGFQAGQYLNAIYNATWIKTDGQTVKERGLGKVDLDFLNKPCGLLVSLCTGVAQRVPLREVVAEVMLPMMDARMDKIAKWKSLSLTGEGVMKEMKKPTFRAWFDGLNDKQQRTLYQSIRYVLRQICWTGVNSASDLVVSCPMLDNANACVHVSMEDSRALRSILKDTERSATFACLTNTCFIVEPWLTECQKRPQPPWRNQIPALVTSVCQYQWSGANDWNKVIKLPQDHLEDEGDYWMGTNDYKRKVTVETDPIHPIRLTISNSEAPWRHFRRAWERFGKVRKHSLIELRERTMMIEEHAREVVIMRKQNA